MVKEAPRIVYDVYGPGLQYGNRLDKTVIEELVKKGIVADYGSWTDMGIIEVLAQSSQEARRLLIANAGAIEAAFGVKIGDLDEVTVESCRRRFVSPYSK